MAHKKGVGSSKNGRDSNPKMLGVKRYDGESSSQARSSSASVAPRFIGKNVGLGRDFTIFSKVVGR
jgi:large subunit ribosomal protein L27